MTTNKEKKLMVASGSAPNTSSDAVKEAFTKRLTLKLEEKLKRPAGKPTEPHPVSGKGI
jgi:hypothetical protein